MALLPSMLADILCLCEWKWKHPIKEQRKCDVQNKVTQQLALGAFIRNSSLLKIATKNVKFCNRTMESLQTVRVASQGEALVKIPTQIYTGKTGKHSTIVTSETI